jgi:hypothetical protein
MLLHWIPPMGATDEGIAIADSNVPVTLYIKTGDDNSGV